MAKVNRSNTPSPAASPPVASLPDAEANRATVRRLWECFAAHDWPQARLLLADNFVADWPHTGERIRGADNFIAVNAHYPPVGWRIEIRRLVASGDEVAVPHNTGVFYAASFFTLRAGQIQRATEYWVDGGAEAPPAWRAGWVESP